MTSIVYARKRDLTYNDVRRIFKKVDVNKVSTAVPIGNVEKHSVYVYRVNVDTNSRYWRYDGLRWKSLRSKTWPKDDPEPWCKRISHQLIVDGRSVDLQRQEYSPFGCKIAPPNAWKSPYVVVHYKGRFDLQRASNAPHGNYKSTPMKSAAKLLRELIGEPSPPTRDEQELSAGSAPPVKARQTARKRTGGLINQSQIKRRKLNFGGADCNVSHLSPPLPSSPSMVNEKEEDSESTESQEFFTCPTSKVDGFDSPKTMPAHGYHITHPNVGLQIKDKLKNNKSPAQALKEATREAIMEHGDGNPSLLPRNRKQAYNVKQQLNMEQRHDDLFETYRFAKEHPEVILEIDLIPQVIIIQTHPDMIEHVQSLSKTFKHVVFHYDTTFDVGAYFTSILSMRHPLFKKEPMIPVAVMYHETTNEAAHCAFFKVISLTFGLNSSNTIIVTDREKSITNSIKNQMPLVKNLFCWNHLRRNVGDWVTKRISSAAASFYKNEVITILQSISEEDYFSRLQSAKKSWDSGFQQYYETFLESDVRTSYRPVLETIGIYNELSGITNNPAESTNAVFKRITNLKNASFFQALSAVYFFQTDILFDVFRGMKRQGEFVLSVQMPVGIHSVENIKDVVDPDIVASLVVDGKIPANLCSNKKYTSVSLYEATTMRGMAMFYINNDRIQWLPAKGVFVVSGVLERNYIVSLKTNNCSCLRTGICEHLLAVMISTGVQKKSVLKRCQPNIGSIYRKTVKKATGKKKGQGKLRRLILPKQNPTLANSGENLVENVPAALLFEDGEQVATDSIKSSPPQMDFQLGEPPQQIVDAATSLNGTTFTNEQDVTMVTQKLMHDHVAIPRLNRENYGKTFLSFPTGNISLAEMKSVETSITLAEKRLLSKLNGNRETVDWMVDSVISGFMFLIADLQNGGVISLTAQEAKHVLRGEDSSLLFAARDMDEEDYYDWNKINRILIPLHLEENHWILIVLSPTSREIQVFDPVGHWTPSRLEQTILQDLFNPKFNIPTKTEWKIKRPEAALSIGVEAMQCGAFICFYAEAVVKGWNINSYPGSESYRKHIAATLIGNCLPFRSKPQKKCFNCQTVTKTLEMCSFCKRVAHFHCLNQVSIRGREYYVCGSISQSSGTLLLKS